MAPSIPARTVARAAPADAVAEAVSVEEAVAAVEVPVDSETQCVSHSAEPSRCIEPWSNSAKRLTRSGRSASYGGHASRLVGGRVSAWAGGWSCGRELEGRGWSTEAHVAGDCSDSVIALKNKVWGIVGRGWVAVANNLNGVVGAAGGVLVRRPCV